MTTIGVTPAPSQRVLPMDVPSYVYGYPSTQSVQLAAVKTGLFHPKLPTFRRMDMDTAGHKLPAEHCRTTTSAGPVDFQRATTTLFTPPERKLNTAQITETGRQLHRHYTTPQELKNTRMEWSNFLNRSPERFNIRLPELPDNKGNITCTSVDTPYATCDRKSRPLGSIPCAKSPTSTSMDSARSPPMLMPATGTRTLSTTGTSPQRPGGKHYHNQDVTHKRHKTQSQEHCKPSKFCQLYIS